MTYGIGVRHRDRRRAIEAAAPGHVAAVRRALFEHLTREQVAALARLSERVLDRLDDRLDQPGDS